MCYCPTPTLHLNLALTGDGAFLLAHTQTHTHTHTHTHGSASSLVPLSLVVRCDVLRRLLGADLPSDWPFLSRALRECASPRASWENLDKRMSSFAFFPTCLSSNVFLAVHFISFLVLILASLTRSSSHARERVCVYVCVKVLNPGSDLCLCTDKCLCACVCDWCYL